jgi:hypothetical protein
MKTLKMSRVLGAVPVVVMAWSMSIGGQAPQALTAQDKAEIQSLFTGYAKALGSCAANEYADLVRLAPFAQPYRDPRPTASASFPYPCTP